MRWVLLRGWAREARHWGEFPAQLKTAFPDAEVSTPDLPGNGARHAERSPASVSSMVDFLGRKGNGEKLHLLGLSLGAMVCVDWARRYPEEIAGCVLVNTSLRPFSPFHQRLRPVNYPAILGFLMEQNAQRREAGILSLTSAGATGELAQAWAGYANEHPVARANVLRQLLAAARYEAPREKPAPPVLVLSGARDRLVDPRCSQALAQRWNVPVVVHPSAGHDLTLDDGPWVAAQAARWLSGTL